MKSASNGHSRPVTVSASTIRRLAADPAMTSLRRSLDYYYGDTGREHAMDAMYGRFVRPGDLVFDIGSHVGDRIACFRRLGARVVAVEPQPICVRALRALYGRDDHVTLVQAACGRGEGAVPLHINSRNPTVSTNSPRFPAAATGACGWEGEVWDREIVVDSVSLDALVERFGEPAFIKIDVEGYEDVVLAGLSRPVAALSFEFTTIVRDVAGRCLDRAAELGFAGFDVSLGESMAWTFGRWVGRDEMAAHLRDLPDEANAGDIYAVRVCPPDAGGYVGSDHPGGDTMTDEHIERGAQEEAAGVPLTPTEAEAEKRPASHTAGEPSDDSADDEPHRPE